MRSGSAIISIVAILPPVIVKANTTRDWPPCAHTAPAAPSMSAGRAAAARPENVPATARAPTTSLSAPICAAAASARSTMSGSSIASRASKSPSREAARKAATTSRCRETSGRIGSPGPACWIRRRARLASCRVAVGESSTIGAISSNGTANMSCSTNASRSAGVSVSSTTSKARPTESASTASCSGSVPGTSPATGWPAGGVSTAPVMDEPYYVGFKVNGQDIGLDPHGHNSGAVGYFHVGDIRGTLQALLEAGAEVDSDLKDVGGRRLIASVKDADGNLIGLLQDALRVGRAREQGGPGYPRPRWASPWAWSRRLGAIIPNGPCCVPRRIDEPH
jgi:predicted enzyme related to lactoylglutathione lyase